MTHPDIEKLRAALEPFAPPEWGAVERILWGDFSDDQPASLTIKLGDIRRAREALALLSTLKHADETEGSVAAPLEPTKEMSLAGRKKLAEVADRMEEAKLLSRSSIDFWQRVGHRPADEIYTAMLATRPYSSPEREGE